MCVMLLVFLLGQIGHSDQDGQRGGCLPHAICKYCNVDSAGLTTVPSITSCSSCFTPATGTAAVWRFLLAALHAHWLVRILVGQINKFWHSGLQTGISRTDIAKKRNTTDVGRRNKKKHVQQMMTHLHLPKRSGSAPPKTQTSCERCPHVAPNQYWLVQNWIPRFWSRRTASNPKKSHQKYRRRQQILNRTKLVHQTSKTCRVILQQPPHTCPLSSPVVVQADPPLQFQANVDTELYSLLP